jgi:hypothetical protein
MLKKSSRAISSVNWLELAWLISREDSMNFSLRERFGSYK